jgi:hypothetical protein
MANNNFRSDRGRDPLAELARLIGQGDASPGGRSRESHDSARPRASAARDVDWAPEDRYAAPEPRGETRYAAPLPSAPSYPSSSSDYYAPQQAQDHGYQDHGSRDHGSQEHGDQEHGDQEHGYQDPGYQDHNYQDHNYQDRGYGEPAGSRFFSGPAAQFNGFREEPDLGLQRFHDEGPQHLPSARDLSAYPSAPEDHGYQADEYQYADDEAAPADRSYQQTRNPGRRTALVAVMAVFGLVVVGSAGAFGYRAMFGGSVLPTLPPIIKASNGPNKIALDPQAGAASNAAQAVATTGSTESLVSREEQPVTIDAPKPAPRMVSTIPIVTNGQSAMPSGMSGMPPATTGPNRVAAADSPWPAPPSPLPAPAAAPPAASPPPAQVSSEPKKIHTVTIRADQTGAVPDAAAGSPASGAARTQGRSAGAPRAAAPAATGSAAPMSIIPGQGDAAPAPHARTAVAATAPSAAPSPGGGSYVQVTSRRTEGEAQIEFRALQAKFPGQLSGREPIIRRADLGEKGIYYRALVGPFASTEEAAQLCSALKAAGQNCIVQRN